MLIWLGDAVCNLMWQGRAAKIPHKQKDNNSNG